MRASLMISLALGASVAGAQQPAKAPTKPPKKPSIAIPKATEGRIAPATDAWSKRYAQMNQAMLKLDSATFVSFLAPDFTHIDANGKTTKRADFQVQLSAMMNNLAKFDGRTKILGVKPEGNLIRVGYRLEYRVATNEDPNLVSTGVEVGVDYWKPVGGRYQLVRQNLQSNVVKAPDILAKPKAKKVSVYF